MQLRKIGILLFALVLALTMAAPAYAATGYPDDTYTETPYVPSTPAETPDPTAASRLDPATPASPVVTAPAASAVVNATPAPVTAEAVSEAASAAIENVAAGETATVKMVNVTTVSATALQDVFAQAAAAEKTAVVNVDVVAGNAVATRVYVTEAIAAALTGDVNLSVSVDPAVTAPTVNFFNTYFSNEVAVVSLGQQGAYGASIPMAVQLDLTNLNTETLVFYSYDKATNTYTAIPAANYRIDGKGYLHFTTPVGGEIVITDAPLTLK
jgi:predicted ribonuclease toxin of YeeF-YezG toxin-antitoxin module